jgi:P27 family predicted phage terminase small subunit
LNLDEPKPELVCPDPPEWLDADARAEWERLVPELHELGLATRVDAQALGCYCQAVSRLAAAEKTIAADGMTVRSPDGWIRKHPAVLIARDCADQIRKFGGLFGLAPADRSRIHVSPKPAKTAFERFLEKRQRKENP